MRHLLRNDSNLVLIIQTILVVSILLTTSLLIARNYSDHSIYAQDSNPSAFSVKPVEFSLDINSLETTEISSELENTTDQQLKFTVEYPNSELIEISGPESITIEAQETYTLVSKLTPIVRDDYTTQVEIVLSQQLTGIVNEFKLSNPEQSIEINITSRLNTIFREQRLELIVIASIVVISLFLLVITALIHIKESKKRK